MTGSKREEPYERKLRMLRQLSLACSACTICELGRKDAEKEGVVRDPHVFSSMNPVRVVVVGQGPGWNELIKGVPFVGAAGKNFDDELSKHSMGRDLLYVTNTIKCWIKDNAKPSQQHIERCSPFLQMELALIKPKLIVTLGAVAFSYFCPLVSFADSLQRITTSTRPGVEGYKVFAIFHPSPLNLRDETRLKAFRQQVKVLCRLMGRLDTSSE